VPTDSDPDPDREREPPAPAVERGLRELARRIQARPWNRPGTDKSWVLRVMWEQRRFQREVREARRGAGTG
jgi:hypothetical protein